MHNTEVGLANRVTNLLLVGLNHRSAPVEVRERLAFSNGFLEPAFTNKHLHHPIVYLKNSSSTTLSL